MLSFNCFFEGISILELQCRSASLFLIRNAFALELAIPTLTPSLVMSRARSSSKASSLAIREWIFKLRIRGESTLARNQKIPAPSLKRNSGEQIRSQYLFMRYKYGISRVCTQ